MNDNLDLDERLSELFSQPSLSLTPRPNATASVLSRVRTARRRRRAIQVAGPALLAVLIAVGTFSDVGSRWHAAPAPPAGSTAPVDPTTGELVMSGKSVGTLQLGMSKLQVEATGLVKTPARTPDEDPPGCRAYEGVPGDGKRGIVQAIVGPNGLEQIQVYTFIRTPEDTGIGDAYTKLQATYPGALPAVPSAETDYEVTVPGRPQLRYVFTFGPQNDTKPLPSSSRVVALALVTAHRSCA